MSTTEARRITWVVEWLPPEYGYTLPPRVYARREFATQEEAMDWALSIGPNTGRPGDPVIYKEDRFPWSPWT